MRFERFREGSDTGFFPLTAMIDVLFLMIIFLVLGANFDPVETVDLPEARGRPAPGGEPRVEVRADGSLRLSGSLHTPTSLLEALRALSPQSVILLPERRLQVGDLFRLYDLLGRELRIPVRIGVRAPSSQHRDPVGASPSRAAP